MMFLYLIMHAALNSLPKKSLSGLVNQLYTAKLISNEVREALSMDECLNEFKANLTFLFEMADIYTGTLSKVPKVIRCCKWEFC